MNGAGPPFSTQARKGFALLTVLGAHLALLFALIVSRTVVLGTGSGALTVVSLAAPSNLVPPVAAQPPSRPLRTPHAKGENPVASAPPASAAESSQGETCAPLEAIGADLSGDRPSLAAIESLPLRDPPATDPVVLWNEGWTPLATSPPAPLAHVRLRIATVLASQPPECLAQPVIGPRFLTVPTLRGANLLVFGSGLWFWQDLVSDPGMMGASEPTDDADSLFSRILDEL